MFIVEVIHISWRNVSKKFGYPDWWDTFQTQIKINQKGAEKSTSTVTTTNDTSYVIDSHSLVNPNFFRQSSKVDVALLAIMAGFSILMLRVI